MGPEVLCWCGFSHRHQHCEPYRCLPFSVLKERPNLEAAFRACGCDPGRGEVGIVCERDWAAQRRAPQSAQLSSEKDGS